MVIKNGKANIRYIVMDTTHEDYADTIVAFTTIHSNKELGNTLTVLPNIANTQSIVKVVGHVGWLEDEATRLADGLASGLMIDVFDYDNIDSIHALLASAAWPQDP